MLAGDDEGPTGRDLKFRSPLSPHPRPPAAPLQVARPACGRRALPTVLPVVVLPLARHPCRCPAPPAARLLPCPLGPRVPTRGRPEGGTDWRRLLPAEPGGAAQTGQTGPSGAAASGQTGPRNGGRQGRRRGPGGAAAAPATHPPAGFSPPRQPPSPHPGHPKAALRGLGSPHHPPGDTA